MKHYSFSHLWKSVIVGWALLVALLVGPALQLRPTDAALGGNTNDFTGTATIPERIIFTSTSSMGYPRIDHAAVRLNDGKVLVAGGNDGAGNFLSSAELYDPVSKTWTPTGSMNHGRLFHTATVLNNGIVLVAGGPGPAAETAELYDPSTGQWTLTGSMNFSRQYHQATLLNNGQVLVSGGFDGSGSLNSAEIYNPATGVWTGTGWMGEERYFHRATLLNDGNVLVSGGTNSDGLEKVSAEIYDSSSGTWYATGTMYFKHYGHTATLLNNGKVLVSSETQRGGITAELFDPSTGTWSFTGDMICGREFHQATLLNNGKVLVTGGDDYFLGAEWYDPLTSVWSYTGDMNQVRSYHTATLLDDSNVLVVGGQGSGGVSNVAELGVYYPANTVSATLTLPAGWTPSRIFPLSFVANATGAPIMAGALSNDGANWGDWIPATNGITSSTTWEVNEDGIWNIHLRLKDTTEGIAEVVIGSASVDTTSPSGTLLINGDAQFTNTAEVALTLSGNDPLSGLAEMSFSNDGTSWSAWEPYTSHKDWSLTNGDGEKTVYARLRDVAGNVSLDITDTIILDQTEPVPGDISLNLGAVNTSSLTVDAYCNAQDALSGVSEVSFSNDGTTWSAWETYVQTHTLNLPSGDGEKMVSVRFRDSAGNISAVVSDTIILDTTVPTEYGFSINNGSLFTNSTYVILYVGADIGTHQIMVSNDGGFSGAQWEPYVSHKEWTITSYGNYVIPRVVYLRYMRGDGSITPTYQDDIILDVTPPEGSFDIISGTLNVQRNIASANPFLSSLGLSNIQAHSMYLPVVMKPSCVACVPVLLLLTATDDVSGVGYVLISNTPNFAGTSWRPFSPQMSWWVPSTGTTTVYLKYRDNAGNESEVYSSTYTP